MARFLNQIKTALTNPANACSLVTHRLASGISYTLSSLVKHNAFPPEAINIYPTDRCNLKCQMCFEKLRDPRPELTINQWTRIISRINEFKPRVHISGGEPFLYREISRLITELKSHDLFVAITTNGTLLDKFAEHIISTDVNMITVSLDGPESIHDAIRGLPGTFAQLMKGIQKINRLKKNRNRPVIRINSMVNITSPEAMQEIIRIATRINADTVQFLHTMFVSNNDVRLHQQALNKAGLALNYWQGADLSGEKPADFDSFYNQLVTLSQKKSIRVEVFPFFHRAQLESYYSLDKNFYRLHQGRCKALWSTATLLPSGELESCPDFIIGNCKDQDILKLWNNREMKELRNRLRQGNFFSVCRACCFFYL